MSSPDVTRVLTAPGQKVLRRAVRLWRDMDPAEGDYRRGILRGLILALAALWGVEDGVATVRVRELAEAGFALQSEGTVAP